VGVRFTEVSSAMDSAIGKLMIAEATGQGRTTRRKTLRVRLDARARFVSDRGWSDCVISDASLSGALVVFEDEPPGDAGDHVIVDVPEVGIVTARVARKIAHGLGLDFEEVSEDLKDRLIRFLYTVPRTITVTGAPRARTIVPIMLKRLFGPDLGPRLRHDKAA
jgi:hypothetical protein